jgi:hypothetical protein
LFVEGIAHHGSTTLRALLAEAIQEFGSQLLSDLSIDIEEVAFLL